MKAHTNDWVRGFIALGNLCIGFWLTVVHRGKLRGYRRDQEKLAQRFNLATAGAPQTFEIQQPRIEKLAQQLADAQLAQTSGSTATPKRVLYTAKRIRAVKWLYIDCFTRMAWAMGWKRSSLYVMSALQGDTSLTSLMLQEGRGPSRWALLQAPYRVHSRPEVQAFTAPYGDTATRALVLMLANPAVLYATNPSTLAAFCQALERDWLRTAQLATLAIEHPRKMPKALRSLVSRGYQQRLRNAAYAKRPLHLCQLVPGLHSFVCWDGGYVRPFLQQFVAHAGGVLRHLPMYSMSTESPQTVTHLVDGHTYFVPCFDNVAYEFFGASDPTQALLSPWQLEPGQDYVMVISDNWGLVRYNTDDVFHCECMLGDVPALSFLRRQSLSYSFTGEKLTEQQVTLACQELRTLVPELRDAHLALVPSWPPGGAVPGYKLVVVGAVHAPPKEAATVFGECLAAINLEYAHKIETHRLLPPQLESMSVEAFAQRMGGARHQDSWQAQFKFLPLYRRLWKEETQESNSASLAAGQ